MEKRVKKEHIKVCSQCKADGGKRAIWDERYLALAWYTKFYDEYHNRNKG